MMQLERKCLQLPDPVKSSYRGRVTVIELPQSSNRVSKIPILQIEVDSINSHLGIDRTASVKQ